MLELYWCFHLFFFFYFLCFLLFSVWIIQPRVGIQRTDLLRKSVQGITGLTYWPVNPGWNIKASLLKGMQTRRQTIISLTRKYPD
jgi:uncharacterized protein (DUF1684 family)